MDCLLSLSIAEPSNSASVESPLTGIEQTDVSQFNLRQVKQYKLLPTTSEFCYIYVNFLW